MSAAERQKQYKAAVEKYASAVGKTRFSDAFGVSNSAKVIGDGLFAFNANFDSFTPDVDQIAVHCWLRFPPEDEIYFTIFVRDGLSVLADRLQEMRAAGGAGAEDDGDGAGTDDAKVASSPDGLSYTNNSKNVKGYIAKDGLLYLRNKSYWDTMPADLSTISKPVSIDQVVFAIWPPAATASRGLLAREFIGYLGGLIGRERVHELRVWEDAAAVDPLMQRLPASVPVDEIEAAVAASGGYYPAGEVGKIHAALNFLPKKHFVILSGLSGSGKTQLALRYAHAVHGFDGSANRRDPFLFVCPVRPEWTDPTGLTGYYDVLSRRYVVPPFLEAMLLATAHSRSPVFVVLDELNLARVEYYFSDILSCIESDESLKLHSSGVPIEGSNGSAVPAELPVPANLYITGTINVDETTNTVSDKVLDRAVVIDMSGIDLDGFVTGLEAREPALASSCAACRPQLLAAHATMSAHGHGFGYRVAEEVLRYHAFAVTHLKAATSQIIDDLMVQKVLLKLRGSERQRPLLTGLLKVLDGLPRSCAFLNRLLSDLDEFGSFQAGR
jgi:hypothetical protein